MPPTKTKNLIELSEKGGNDADLLLFDLIFSNTESIEQAEDKIARLKTRLDDAEDSIDTFRRKLMDTLRDGSKFKELLKEQEVERLVTRVATRLIDIKKGADGHTPTKQELLDLILPLIPPIPEKGEKGDTPLRGRDYWTEKDQRAIVERILLKIPKGETLSGDETIGAINAEKTQNKIKKERVEGFEELQERINNFHVMGGGGGRQFRGAQFSFAGDGDTSVYTLPKEAAGKGLFIFAHYQGQWLQKDTHYTVAGKTFTCTGWAPKANTVIEGFLINF